jgi:aminopeptidase N
MSGIAPVPTTDLPRSATHIAWCLAGAVAAFLLGAGAAQARGLGDPFFPGAGNPGYDVLSYEARLSYSPQSGGLRATATISATASRRLRRFSLDLDGMRVTGVTVDGSRARFSRGGGKLTVVPPMPSEAGDLFTAVVSYRGVPRRVIDPDGGIEGWVRTDDGAVALGEPVGTASWLPCNNTPLDKASFRFQITVPEGLKGVANGRLLAVRDRGQRKTFVWSEAQPMAPYLATIDIGRARLVRSEIAGVPAWTAVDPRLKRAGRHVLRALPGVVRFESQVFGPYPFDALGSIVDPAPVGYALETQTRPVYPFQPGRELIVHEMAHQWFGDSVGLTRWPEIWLSEGFATWAEWYYVERHGGRSARRTFEGLYRTPASAKRFWNPPSGHPGTAKNLFATSVYERGAMALQALRMKVGTEPLLTVLRRWVAEHRHGNATIPQFIALAEEVSGQQLDQLFSDWLYQPGKPPGYG